MGLKQMKRKTAAALVVVMSALNSLTPLAEVGTPSVSTKSIKVTFQAGSGGVFDLEKVASTSNATTPSASSDSSTEKQLVRVFTKLEKEDKTNYGYTSLLFGGEEKGEDYSELIMANNADVPFQGWYCDGTKVEDETNIYSDITLEARWYTVEGNLKPEEQEALAVETNLPAGESLVLNALTEEKINQELSKNEAGQKALEEKLQEANLKISSDSPMFGLDIDVKGTTKTVDITMNIPDVFAEEDASRLRIVHFADDFSAVKEFITPEIKDNRIRFTMNGFSPVAIVLTEEKAQESGDPEITIKNVKNGYILAWTEERNAETDKTERTYLPLDEAVALKEGTEIFMEPNGYGSYYSDGWLGKLESLKEVKKDGTEEKIAYEYTEYGAYIRYDKITYTVKESCTIQADFSRWVPELQTDSNSGSEQEQPEFRISINPSSSSSNRYRGRVSVDKWDAASGKYVNARGCQVRIATEEELSELFEDYLVKRYVADIANFTCKDNVISSTGTPELTSYTIPFVIIDEEGKEHLARTENQAYTGYINLGASSYLYFNLVSYNGKYEGNSNQGGKSLYSGKISITQNTTWQDVRESLLNGLANSWEGTPKMYNYPILSWQDENGKEFNDNYTLENRSFYAYTLFKDEDGNAYHVEAEYDEGPLTDATYEVLIKNVDNGYLSAYTGTYNNKTYLPLDETVVLPANTKITINANGYNVTEEDKEWEGKLTSLKLISGTEVKDILEKNSTYYTITLNKDYRIEPEFTKVVKTEEKEFRKFNLYVDDLDTSGTYSSKVELRVLKEGEGSYEQVDPSAYTLRIATEEDFFNAGISSDNYDGDLFTYKDGILSSKAELPIEFYRIPFIITYQGQEWFYDEINENCYYATIAVGVNVNFYHSTVKFGNQYDQQNGSDFISQIRIAKDGNEKWNTAEVLFDSSEEPKMYNYDFAGWQNYKGEKYEPDSALVCENENARYYTAFDRFVKKEDPTKAYEPKAMVDGKEPVLPENPVDPDNPDNPSNPSNPGTSTNGGSSGSSGSSGGGGGGSRSSGKSSSTNRYTMTGSWIADINGWKFLKSSGEYAANTWGWINSQYYYFDAAGRMVTGWHFIDGRWYYLNSAEGSLQGAMLTGVIFDPVLNAWFYMDANGAMTTGWQQINEKWYYFNPIPDGRQGALLADTYIDGYYVGADGAWIPAN